MCLSMYVKMCIRERGGKVEREKQMAQESLTQQSTELRYIKKYNHLNLKFRRFRKHMVQIFNKIGSGWIKSVHGELMNDNRNITY